MNHINRMKKKNHSIISKDIEKAFHNIQQPFMIKKKHTTQQIRNFLNLLNSIYKKIYIYHNQWWKNACFPKIRNKTKMFTLTRFYWAPDVLASEIRQEKNI